jgi:GNAT superfamily N-acetyltransferase
MTKATIPYENMIIRHASENDIGLLTAIAAEMKAQHEPGYFERCFAEQGQKRRTIFIAEEGGKALGYAQVNWLPIYRPFRRLGIPELQDLNVIPAARRQGLGRALVEACEKAARDQGCADMGISVGVHTGFGAAQRLYVRLGYIPDGAGVSHDDVPVPPGEMRAVDDLLTLKLVKSLHD